MPWMKKHEGDKWCVYKQGADKQPTGSSLGCHPSEDKATEQMRALYASEADMGKSEDFPVVDGAQAIKTLSSANGVTRVGGHLVLFGDKQQKDLVGEFFTAKTDYHLDWFEKRPMFYHHGLDPQFEGVKVGTIDTLKTDAQGIYAEAEIKALTSADHPDWEQAQLDLHNQWVDRVVKLIDKGVLGWSSGALPTRARKDKQTGEIKEWGIIEGSATPTPCEPRMAPMSVLKTAYEELGANTDTIKAFIAEETGYSTDDRTDPVKGQAAASEGNDGDNNQVQSNDTNGDTLMLTDEMIARVAKLAIKTYLDELKTELTEAQKTDAETEATAKLKAAVKDDGDLADAAGSEAFTLELKAIMDRVQGLEDDKLTAAIKANIAKAKPQSQVPAYSNKGQITSIHDNKFDHLSAEDLVFGAEIMYKAYDRGMRRQGPSEEWLKATAFKVMQQADKADTAYTEDAYAIKSALPVKTDEIFATNLTNNGAYFVGVTYDSQLWYKVREAPIYQQLLAMGMFDVTIGQGSNSIYIPTEGSDPTWYNLVELNDEETTERLPVLAKSSNPTVGRRQITPGLMGARVSFTDIEAEDSMVPVLPFQRYLMERSAQEQFEYVMINGDTVTTGSTNLNLIDGSPSVDGKGRGPVYLMTDGLMKLPIITTAALRRSGGSFDETDFLETLKLMPSAQQVAYDRLVFLVDPTTYLAAMNIPAFKTRDVFNPSTLESGQLRAVYGIRVIRSGQMALANSAGKIPAAGGTLGRILLVRPDQWALARKRSIQTEVDRDIDAQATIVVSTMRWGMTYRSATAGAAATYNLTV